MILGDVEEVNVNFEHERIEFNNTGYPLSFLGLDSEADSGYKVNFTIKGTYDKADGKFS